MCSWSTGVHWHKVCQLAILNLFSPFFLQNSSPFVFSQVSGTSPMPITTKLHTTLWMSEGEKRQLHHSASHFSFARLFCVHNIIILTFLYADTLDSVWPTLPTREFSASIIIFLAILILLNWVLNLFRFLILLNRGKLDVLHLVGHSLGAHAMGKVSKINLRSSILVF